MDESFTGVAIGAIFGVVGALFGGFAAAIVTARAAQQTDRRAVREKARLALWRYHRALSGYAGDHLLEAGYGEEQLHLTQADFPELVKAHKAAYPWAGFLPADQRSRLIRDIAIDRPFPYPGSEVANADVTGTHAMKLAAELEAALELAFPVGGWNGIIARVRARKAARRRSRAAG